MKKILIIAGPNGAGKTTFAREFLPHEADCPEFVNADLIAEGLSPFSPARVSLAAGRLMHARIDDLARSGYSFAFETTLATRSYLQRISRWRKASYRVRLYFLSLPDPELAVRRVANRVKQGGHSIPDRVIRRRFHRGLENLRGKYLRAVDEWSIYDAGSDSVRLIDSGENPPPTQVMEDSSSYPHLGRQNATVQPLNEPDFINAQAAFDRGTAKAIAQAIAAGLEPAVSQEKVQWQQFQDQVNTKP